MELDDFETTIKVIVVGNGGVGKSSMTARYCKGVFTDTYKKTIGVDFLEKTLESGLPTGESVKLLIWDTAGQEEFDALTASYYRGAGACAIVFSSTDRASFEAVERWKQKVEAEFEGRAPPVLALVQNKADLLEGGGAGGADGGAGGGAGAGQMSAAEVAALASRLGMPLFLTSVKRDSNVKEVFEFLAVQHILRDRPAPPQAAPARAAAAPAPAPTASAPAPASSGSGAASAASVAASVASGAASAAPAAGLAAAAAAAPAVAAATGAAAVPTPPPLAQPAPASVAAPAAASAAAAGTIKLGGAADEKAARRRPKKSFSFC
jgi:Ras-related protein Rab-23